MSATPKKRAEEEAVPLPCYLPDARYSVVVPGGGAASWTSGIIYIMPNGFYFLSVQDGYDSESKAIDAAREPLDAPKRLAPLSVFVPKSTAKRLVHGQFIGSFLEMATLKIPLRLSNDAWKLIKGACRAFAIPVET